QVAGLGAHHLLIIFELVALGGCQRHVPSSVRKMADHPLRRLFYRQTRPPARGESFMSTIAPRLSPIHHLLEARGAQWGLLDGTPIALRFGPDEIERAALPLLGLCDVSALRKLGVKGPGAEGWLRE